jgi:hypothetical protein
VARRVEIVLEDDLDGSTADETVKFGLDGKDYEIDLSAEHATQLREALAPFVENGRRLSGKKRSSQRGQGSGSAAGAIRAWARENGVPVNERGRISADVVEKYNAATGNR